MLLPSLPCFPFQHQDLQYMIENIWGCQSALSACSDLYDLVMVRWDKRHEWSPWNTILLTKDEADEHLKLCDLEKVKFDAFNVLQYLCYALIDSCD